MLSLTTRGDELREKKNLFLVSESYFKFSSPMLRIFKILLRHYNWPIRCLAKNSWVAKIRFKKL